MMREKRRYLQLQIISQKKFSEEEAKHLIYESVFQLLGEQGASEAALQVKAFDFENQKALVKCSLSSYQKVIAALALKAKFRDLPVSIRLQKVYGTLEKAKTVFPSLKKAKGY
ncbi:MAG: Rpp14/Pop5 family protein [Candidatus Micrarchaeota archaeon]